MFYYAVFCGNHVIETIKILNTAFENQEIRSVMSKYQTQIDSKNNKTSRLDIVLQSSTSVIFQ
ncbi:MAG: hypothetical protein IJU54_00530 [Alphaproteobacteria bacterium]|nr:hypothetical protein [Alphaproteobacteria bacterium]